MLVDWREPRLLRHVTHQPGRDAKQEIQDAYVDGNFKLVPGINSVDPKKWEIAVKTPLFKHYLENDRLVVITGKDGKPVGVKDLASVSEREASKIVAATNQEELLLGWQKSEKRDGVLKAIATQIGVLEQATAPVLKKRA